MISERYDAEDWVNIINCNNISEYYLFLTVFLIK